MVGRYEKLNEINRMQANEIEGLFFLKFLFVFKSKDTNTNTKT